jgi:hypothetical protein
MDKTKLAIIILGNRNAGKSITFYELFGRVIRTGYKKIKISKEEVLLFVKNSSFEETDEDINEDVFVRNASFEEYGDEIEDFFDEKDLPRIVLCAVQYNSHGIDTINYFKDHGYYLHINWLNPGFYDGAEYADSLQFESIFSNSGKFLRVSGKAKEDRVIELKKVLANWIIDNR